jgi:hypothetical protein
MIKISIKTNRNAFDKKYTKVSRFGRDLSNGMFTVNNITNRKFWADNVDGGFYKFNLDEDIFEMDYYLKLKNQSIDTLHLKTMIRNRLECEITHEILPEKIEYSDMKYVRSGIVKIGQDYFNK